MMFGVCRDVREFKARVDSYSREMLRKEAQIRDLQTRLDQGEGSEYFPAAEFCALYDAVLLGYCDIVGEWQKCHNNRL